MTGELDFISNWDAFLGVKQQPGVGPPVSHQYHCFSVLELEPKALHVLGRQS